MRLPVRALLQIAGASAVMFAATSAQADSAGDAPVSDFDLFGRVMVDYAAADSRNTNFEVDDFELRRARIGASLRLMNKVKLKSEINIDESGDIEVTDAYLSFRPDSDLPTIKIGQFKTPNSLDELTSSRFISGHERPAFTDAFDLDRRVGVAITDGGEQYSYFLGVYGQNIHDDATFGGYAVAGRLTYNPIIPTEDLTVHTGVSFRYRSLDEDQSNFRYRQRPVTHNQGRIIGTDRIADSDVFAGFEAAVLKKSFWFAGEYAATFADCASCAEDPTFTGGYVEAGYMFGGRRTMKKGQFDRPKLDGHPLGALSVFFRLDTIDLSDGATSGGSYTSYTLGQDWWITDHVHVGVNGFLVDAKLGDTVSGLDPAFAEAIANMVSEDTVKGVTVRAQFDF